MRTRGWVLVPAGGNNVQEKAGFLLLVASVGHYQEKRRIADKVKCISNRFKSRKKKLRLRKILNVVFPSAAAGWAIKSNGDVFSRVVAANQLSCRLS